MRGNMAKISTRGQITVPVAIRRALGVDIGDILAFEKDHKSGFFRVRPVRSKDPSFAKNKDNESGQDNLEEAL